MPGLHELFALDWRSRPCCMLRSRTRCRSWMIVSVALSLAALSVTGCCSSARTETKAQSINASQAAAQVDAAPDRTEKTLTPEQRQLNIESFDVVWTTIRDKHFDPNLNGVDWDALRDEYRPKVEQASTMTEVRSLISEMIDHLGQSHFGIIPASVYASMQAEEEEEANHAEVHDDEEEDGLAIAASDRGQADDDSDADTASESEKEGVTGLTVRVYDGVALVMWVDEGLPAAKAGVKPGWIVERINGKDVAPLIQQIGEEYRDSTLREAIESLSVQGRLDGPIHRTVTVDFRNEHDQTVTLELARAKPPGQIASLGHLPDMYLNFRSKRLPDDIGYIAFSVFIDPASLMPAFGEAVQSYSDARGIIIDLRGNPGGLGMLAMGMAGWFIDTPNQYLGTMKTRGTQLKFVVNPRLNNYDGPLAILIDGCSMSTSEIFAGGMRDLGRARLFGTPTAGAALPSLIEQLPNGDGFQYAFADYVSAGGETLEGRGVTPHVIVKPDRQSLLAGGDPALDAAVAWILAETTTAERKNQEPEHATTER